MDIEKLIKMTLLNSDVIFNLLSKTAEGIPNIDPLRVSVGEPPLIEFHQIGGTDSMYADSEVFRERFTYQITYVTDTKAFSEVRNAMKQAMRSVGFVVTGEYSTQNRYTNLTHYYIHVSQSFDEAWYDRLLKEQEELYNQKHGSIEDLPLPPGEYYDPKTNSKTKIVTDEFEIID